MEYDAGGEFLQGQGSAVQHDDVNYLWNFIQGRGNVTAARRWDVNHETDIAESTASTVGYNTTGSAVFSRDPLGHQTTISYADSFSTNGIDTTTLGFATLAYPTMVTINDPGPISSTVRYNYDLGVVTRKEGPPPLGHQQGAIQTTEYDVAGRVKRLTNAVNSAYTRFVYPVSQTIVNKFTTIKDLATETYTATVFDGAGRVRAVAGDFPDPGSTDHYSGQFTLYDSHGRAVQSTNPTEMTNAWAATGADNAGWHSSSQTYDWKGRPLVTTNQDGTTKEASYGGCGCAGGEVVTLTDEGTIDGGVAKRRQQKIYSDVLGRTVKTELLNWQGGSVYSTTVNTYNARDQVTAARQYQGEESSGVYQETTMTYDGYGRSKTRHVPEQDAGTATIWDYYDDDTVQKVTDARGASASYEYNGRHLVEDITYAAPSGSGITVPAAVSYGYDDAGNRTSMTDGLGSLTQSYDQLSRMSSETRNLTGFGNYTINYQYNLAGDLRSITDPFNHRIDYTRDATGRLTLVTGTPFGSVTTYASNIQYRASGAIKHLNSGDSSSLDTSFNSRLQASAFTISGQISKTYEYYADGSLRFSSDLLNHRFDRSYSFDHLNRLKEAFSGGEARGEPPTSDRPYKQTYGYDSFSHLTERTNKVWWTADNSMSDTYVNNRRVEWDYDADGRLVHSPFGVNTYDAAGHQTKVEASFSSSVTLGLDGEGRQIKTAETTFDEGSETFVTETKYYLHSSVLGGQVLTEMTDASNSRTFVYAGLAKLAWQWRSYGNEYVSWEHSDPSGASVRVVNLVGAGQPEQELDPTGADAGTHAQTSIPDEGAFVTYGSSYNAAPLNMAYSRDGVRRSVDGVDTLGTSFPDWPEFWDWLDSLHPERRERVLNGEESWDISAIVQSRLRNAPQETAMEIAKRKNCATPNSIVERFKQELEAQWERTTRTGEENGSLFFWERATNSYPRISLSEGKHLRFGKTQYAPVVPAMPEIGPETRNAIEYLSKGGRTVDFLAFFHTHPNYPGGDSRSGDPSDGDTEYQSRHKNVLGIIRTGKGYSFFSNGKTFGPNDAKANDCIVDLNKSRN